MSAGRRVVEGRKAPRSWPRTKTGQQYSGLNWFRQGSEGIICGQAALDPLIKRAVLSANDNANLLDAIKVAA